MKKQEKEKTPSVPSLSTLSPEQIRVMCAEASSLDAVAKLEAGLTDNEIEQYIEVLADLTGSDTDCYSTAIFASALQRASAILLTKGLVTL